VMRANDLDHALALQNAVDFGLTAGLHSLDRSEIEHWIENVEAGNLYVNRATTGAVVRRQPFGGWKRSAVGPTAKAGGPNYVATLQRWRDAGADLRVVEAAFATWMAGTGRAGADPSGIASESNELRYRPLPRGVAVRVAPDAPERDVELARRAAAVTGCRVRWSFARDEPEEAFASSLTTRPVDRLRLLGSASQALRRAAHAAVAPVDDAPPVGEPVIELPRWLREQSVTVTRHRHGRLPARRS